MLMTPGMRQAWESANREAATMIQVVLPSTPTTKALYLASCEIRDGNFFWQDVLLNVSPVHAPGAFLTHDVALAKMDFKIGNRRLSYQAPGPYGTESAGNAFFAFNWIGAKVWAWVLELSRYQAPLQVFYGVVIDYEMDVEGVTVHCEQVRDWNQPITPRTIARATYPYAPENAVGQPLPLIIGAMRDVPYRPPWPNAYTNPVASLATDVLAKNALPRIAGGRRTGQAALVDVGLGFAGQKAKVVVAGHQVKRLCDVNAGCGAFTKSSDGKLALLEHRPEDVFNTPTEAGFYIPGSVVIPGCSFTTASKNVATTGSFAGLLPGQAVIGPGFLAAGVTIASITDATHLVLSAFPVANSPGGGATLEFSWVLADYGVLPADVNPIGFSSFQFPNAVLSYGEGARALLDPWNDVSYARVAGTAPSPQSLVATFPSLGTLGRASQCYFYIGYRTLGTITSARAQTFYLFGTKTGTPFPITLPASATPSIYYVRIGGPPDDGSDPWDFSTLYFVADQLTGGELHVFFMGFSQKAVPNREAVTQERIISVVEQRPVTPPGTRPGSGGKNQTTYVPYTVHQTLPATTRLTGQYFANVEGLYDDLAVTGMTAGQLTGVSSALVERPADALAMVLCMMGKQSYLADITYAPGQLGSFVDARAAMKTWKQTDMLAALAIRDNTDVMTAVSWLAQAGLAWAYISVHDGRWKLIPWRDGGPTTYGRALSAFDFLEAPRVATRSLSQLSSGMRLLYGHDSFAGKYLHEVALTPAGSSSGFAYRNLRDEYLDIVAGVNDQWDWVDNGTPRNVSFGPAARTPATLMTGLKAGMNVVTPTNKYGTGWGALVVSGHNDRLDFSRGSVFVANIPPGDYGTMDNMCAAIQTAMNTADGTALNFVTYDRTAHRVNFTAGGATLLFGTGLNKTRSIAPSVGFPLVDVVVNVTGPYLVEEERFIVVGTAPFELPFQSGPNGYLGTRTSLAELLGYDFTRDTNGGNLVRGWTADSPKNNREATLAAAAAKYGIKRDTQVELRAVNDTDTALEIRNRLAAMLVEPRMEITFSSERLPDMQRGDVFTFLADVNDLYPYPKPGTDGSWVGKKFMAVETQQHMGPSWHTEIVAVEVL